MVLAQKPSDMGYLGVEFAMADNAGVTSLPKQVTDGLRGHDPGERRRPGVRTVHLPSQLAVTVT